MSLLIQLFGREVIDRLTEAGFDSSEAIVQAGPERLSQAGGIPAPLARRIVAVAAEACDPEPAAPAEVAPGPAPDAPGAAAPARSKKRRPAHATREGRTRPVDADPFVDDVGLVAWMGFAAKPGTSTSSFPVADAILDPARPANVPDDVPARPAADSSPAAPPTPAQPSSVEAEPAAATAPPAPEGERAGPPAGGSDTGGPARSFWSFGTIPARPAGSARPEEPARGRDPASEGLAPDGSSPPALRPIHRRRIHDGH